LFEFALARGLGGCKLCLDFGAARVFHRAHSFQFFFHASQFSFRDATAGFFSRTFACLGFDPQLLVLSATPGSFFLVLSPSLRFLTESMFGGMPGRFEFGAARLFFRAQPDQFSFELVDLLSDRRYFGRDWLRFRSSRRFPQCRGGER
jgi:hypothetical protein